MAALATAVPVVASAPAAAASIAKCSAANTIVWAAVEGSGTAGTTYYELEFSNSGTKSCTFNGFPSVWAVGKNGLRIGKPAKDRSTPKTVTVGPGKTAHAILGVEGTGAICGKNGVEAAGLRVVPPNQVLPKSAGETDEVNNFPLKVCVNQPSLNVLPIYTGTGIPNYTFT
jgi:opacity protein-like surface antigen